MLASKLSGNYTRNPQEHYVLAGFFFFITVALVAFWSLFGRYCCEKIDKVE